MEDNDITHLENYYIPEDDYEAINRADIIYNTISNNIDLKNKKIIDIGFGGGYLLKNFLKDTNENNLYGLDISNLYINKIKFLNKNNLFIGDATNEATFIDKGKFDITISTDVIEHVFNPIALVNNLINITNIGGYVVLNIPLEVSLKARIGFLMGHGIHDPFNVGGHIRFFKPKDLMNFFGKYKNIEIIKVDYDMWFGKDSLKRKLKKKLAILCPNLFAGRVLYILKKVK